jgi:DNA gyrase subunit A
MEVLSHGQTLFAATEKGYGKRTLHRRISGAETGRQGGHHHQDQRAKRQGDRHSCWWTRRTNVMLMTNAGKLIRMPIEGISVISRNTQGVKLIGMEPGRTGGRRREIG